MSESPQIEIRSCISSELDVLREIAVETFVETFEHLNEPQDFQAYLDKAFSKDKLHSELNDPNSEFYLIHVNEALAGYLKLNYSLAQTEFKTDDGTEIERIYVRADYQGLGIGKALMEYAISKAREKGKSYLWLGVWEKNPKAIAFYERYGFYQFDKHSFKMGGDLQTDILMKLNL